MKQGQIVIIHFPFTNFTESKLRPALVISNKKFNAFANVIILAISTKEGKKKYSLELAQSDMQEGKLLKKSYIRFSNILSIEKKLIIKKVGLLKNEKLKKVKEKVISFIC
ncbi:type II toxin-antitoxin system PemK/MazF family toxin [Candidatus Peregrinibacteria bacterium]|nr:type II toxin-antitoxin system PemK/MazF family toxin [Candidatus Peregrinibacteria bacterium]